MIFDFLDKALDKAEKQPKKTVYAVKVRSALLGDDLVVFRGKENFKQVLQDYPGHTIYFEKEVDMLQGAGPATLKAVHVAKKVFPGSWLIKRSKSEDEKK